MIFLIIAHLTANDKDFSLSLEMTIRESPSHQPLIPAFNREPINLNPQTFSFKKGELRAPSSHPRVIRTAVADAAARPG